MASSLPSGTVCFLVTDVEGGTRLWQVHPDGMRAAMAKHDVILRAAIATHAGSVYLEEGGGLQAAFPSAPAAVAAALDAQLALHVEDWAALGLPAPLRVRMALHAAVVDPAGTPDRSPEPNRMERLLDLAGGGDVLLTDAAATLARDDLPTEAELVAVGERTLRGLDRPERFWRLVHPHLESRPVVSSSSRMGSEPAAYSVPHPRTPLIGREADLAAVRELLLRDDTPLLTITGPGGTGKTRLALALAADLGPTFGDGVAFVGLAPILQAQLVLPTLARALGVPESGSRPLVDRLRAVLHDKRLLLVLDNLEQVMDAVADIADLLPTSPGLTVLATSRVRLRITGEQVYPLPPLLLPSAAMTGSVTETAESPAVRLFVARARAVVPGFALTEENVGEVAAICTRLDGLPLAIELAAARTAVLPPAALLQRLEKRLPLLTAGPRDAPERQRTLRDAIAWSYDLLAPHEQAVFRQLAVFVGGFTLAAAAAVCAPEEPAVDVLDTVASLVDQSLVRRVDAPAAEPRYDMLETIREFGLEQLDAAGEAESTRQRLARWLLDLVEPAFSELFGPDRRRWQRLLEVEHDNLRAVLAWALDQGDAETAQRLVAAASRFWYGRGAFDEGRAWAERALASGPTADLVRSKATVAFAWFASEQGDTSRAIALHDEAVALARRAGDETWLAQALTSFGLALEDQGRFAEAQALHEEALARYRAAGDRVWPPFALNALGLVAHEQGDTDRAEARFAKALAAFRDVGNAYGAGFALTNLAKVARARGDLRRADALFAESLGLRWEYEDKRGILGCLNGLAGVAAATGRFERAARLLGAAAMLREAIGAVAPRYHSRTERAAAEAQSALGEAAFSAAWEAGRALPLAEALAEATAIVAPAPPAGSPAPAPNNLHGLTARERDVLRLIAGGRRDHDIAEELFISRRTVQSHVTHIFGKLGVETRAEATAVAIRLGLV